MNLFFLDAAGKDDKSTRFAPYRGSNRGNDGTTVHNVSMRAPPAGPPNTDCTVATEERAQAFEEQALAALRDGGLRLTSPRVQVVRALGESNRPLTANEIHSRIAASGGRVDSVSVYRILAALQSVGVVHRIGAVDAYYACGLNEDRVHNTQHLVCSECGCVDEVDLAEAVTHSVGEEADRRGFRVADIRLEVLGECAHCQSKEGLRR